MWVVMGIQQERAILLAFWGSCSWPFANVALPAWVMCLAVCTAEGCSRRMTGSVVVNWMVMWLLKCCSYIEHIPVEGLNSGTCREGVAGIETAESLCTGWIPTAIRASAVDNVASSSRSWSLSVAVSRERRGRRTLAVALSRHKVGRMRREDKTVVVEN